MAVFDLYAPCVQDYIYRRNWQNLRAIQVAAAEAIFHTEENVLLTASTASGKTEAAFSPYCPCSIRIPRLPWGVSTSGP